MGNDSQGLKELPQPPVEKDRRGSAAASSASIGTVSASSPARQAHVTLFDLFNEISIIEHLARNKLERALPDGFKVSQFGVLNHLVRVGDGALPVQIAKAFQVAKGAMTNTLQRLEERGMIEVRADEQDGRAKRVFLTEAGRQMRETCIHIANGTVQELGQMPLTTDLLRIVPILTELRKYLDEERSRR